MFFLPITILLISGSNSNSFNLQMFSNLSSLLRARNERAPKAVVRMPQAVILTLLSWSRVSRILTRKTESTRLH
ncbi:hypothetical protein EDD22DRAFT_942388, partial [Suillus occidentalis]